MPTATDFKDFYAILGVEKNASAEEIKRAYRKLARQYHPDLNPGDSQAEQRFKELNEAHEVLSDPEKRAKYDRFGQCWQQAGASGSGPAPDGFDVGAYSSFEDFLNELLGRFGGGAGFGGTPGYSYGPAGGGFADFGDFFGGAASQAAGADLEANLTLSFREAYRGVQQQFQLNGETVKVRIPAGAKPGSRIRVRGKGQVNPVSGQRGDLYLNIDLAPHPVFRFEGDRLVCEVAIAPHEAALGAEIEVPTPDGSVSLKVPAGVKSGQALRLRGKGWPTPKGDRGDQLVRLKLAVPQRLTDEERQAYEHLQQVSRWQPRANLARVQL